MPLKILSEAWKYYVLYETDFQELVFFAFLDFPTRPIFTNSGAKNDPPMCLSLSLANLKRSGLKFCAEKW